MRVKTTAAASRIKPPQSKRLLLAKPAGARRPAWPRLPIQSAMFVSVRVRLPDRQLRPPANANVLASDNPPDL